MVDHFDPAEFDPFDDHFADEFDALHDIEDGSFAPTQELNSSHRDAKRPRLDDDLLRTSVRTPLSATQTSSAKNNARGNEVIKLDFSDIGELVIDETPTPSSSRQDTVVMETVPSLTRDGSMDLFAPTKVKKSSRPELDSESLSFVSQRMKSHSRSRSSRYEDDYSLPSCTLEISPPPPPGDASAQLDIEKIMEAKANAERNRFFESCSSMSRFSMDGFNTRQESTIHQERPLDQNSQKITMMDGERCLYLTVRDEADMIVQPFLPVIFHLLFATSNTNKLQYPRTLYELSSKHVQRSSIIESVLSDVAPGIRSFIEAEALVLDILPYLVEIISPIFRTVSIQLFTANEKKELARIVSIMISHNLTYRQQRNVEGHYSFVLEPAVDELINFATNIQRRQLPYAMKQMLAHEIELERVRRAEPSRGVNAAAGPSSKGEKKKQDPVGGKEVKDKPVPQSNSADGKPAIPMIPKKAIQNKPTTDFFGRRVASSTNQESISVAKAAPSSATSSSSVVFFKYKAGHINAIRRNIRIRDLL